MCRIQEPWEVYEDRERWEATLEKRREREERESLRNEDDYPERWDYDEE